MASPKLKSKTSIKTWANKRRDVKPEQISFSDRDLVEVGALAEGSPLPVVIRPKLDSLDLIQWAAEHRPMLEEKLLDTGGILFRGFQLSSQEDFDRFISDLDFERMYYMEGATPRTQLSEKVYTSTEFPADRSIALHNELNYVVTCPMKIWFFCATAPQRGGETPIADVRRVYELVDPEIRAEFERKGWLLMRNFGHGFGPTWQTSFRVETREELEAYARANAIELEWKEEGRLRTRQVRPAVETHPKTGQKVWFNHVAFWHVSSLEDDLREMFLGELGEENLPYNTYYGDGTPIPEDVVAHLRSVYDQATIAFPWQEGDLLMLDNVLTAHGRKPFEGPRKILAAMAEPWRRDLDNMVH